MTVRARIRSRIDRWADELEIDWFHFGVTSGAFSDSMYGLRFRLHRLEPGEALKASMFTSPPLAAPTWQPWGRYWPQIACVSVEDLVPIVRAPRGGIRYLPLDALADPDES